MVEVRPDMVLEEIRSWLPLQSIPERIHRPIIQRTALVRCSFANWRRSQRFGSDRSPS
jgi:hypothetical protein